MNRSIRRMFVSETRGQPLSLFGHLAMRFVSEFNLSPTERAAAAAEDIEELVQSLHDLGSSKWFHGSCSRLSVGDVLLPGIKTGLAPVRNNGAIRRGLHSEVYVAIREETARNYAGTTGTLAVVRPLSKLKLGPLDTAALSLLLSHPTYRRELKLRSKFDGTVMMAGHVEGFVCDKAEVMEVLE